MLDDTPQSSGVTRKCVGRSTQDTCSDSLAAPVQVLDAQQDDEAQNEAQDEQDDDVGEATITSRSVAP